MMTDEKYLVYHTPECLVAYRKWQAEYTAFTDKYPGLCGDCGGQGGKHWGGTYWEPPSFDECDACVCQGKCARCGEEGLNPDGEDDPCTFCGWNWGKNPDDIAPYWECWGCLPEPDYFEGQ